MQITLSPEAEQFIRQQIADRPGLDASAVIEAALALWRLQQENTPDIPGGVPWTLDSLRAAIQVGTEQLKRGEGAEWNAQEMKDRVRESIERERTAADKRAG